VEAQSIGELSLKGFAKPVAAHAIIRWRDQPASQTPPATNATVGGRGSRS
jgi:hypothetical protein